MQKVIVGIPAIGDSRFKRWAKLLKGVDRTKTNGFAFLGDWLPLQRKAELEVGSLILLYGEEGSRKYARPVVEVRRVEADSSLRCLVRVDGPDWALDLRDQVADMLASSGASESAPTTTPAPDLSGVDDSTLAAELTRRGWVVFAPTPTADIPGRGVYAVVVADGRVRVGMVGVTIPADDAGIVYRGEPSDCVYLARRLVRAGLDTDSPALR
jgi:hypothetical protein